MTTLLFSDAGCQRTQNSKERVYGIPTAGNVRRSSRRRKCRSGRRARLPHGTGGEHCATKVGGRNRRCAFLSIAATQSPTDHGGETPLFIRNADFGKGQRGHR